MLGQFARVNAGEAMTPVSTRLVDEIAATDKEGYPKPCVSLKPGKTRYDEWWMGASSTAHDCPRMYALQAAMLTPPKDVIEAELSWIFAVGHAYHDAVQRETLQGLKNCKILGMWTRYVGNKDGHIDRESTGAQCDTVAPPNSDVERGWTSKPEGDGWVFNESKVRIHGVRTVVKLDGILDWGNGDLEVLEVKTEDQSARDLLNPFLGGAPRKKHIEQVHVAMMATGLRRSRIIYVFKGVRGIKTSIVEHVVELDQAIAEDLVSRRKAIVDKVGEVDVAFDAMAADQLAENDGVHPSDDMLKQWNEDIKVHLKEFAEKTERLPGCVMKSKGRPKTCPGRDLCFGVRKKAAKKK